MAELAIPELALVALVGVSGAGKSTFAAAHFGPFEVLSSDHFRGLVADDVNDQAATTDAFDALFYVAGKRLQAGRLTVVDATHVQASARKALVALAKAHDVLPVAIVLDVPEGVALRRNRTRTDRTVSDAVVRRQADQLRRSLRGLSSEGFRVVHVLAGEQEIAQATLIRERVLNDRRDETGPFDVIGDVHGCRSELETLLGALGYQLIRDHQGRAVDATHPEGRRVIFLGDLVDRGPDTPGVLRLAMGMTAAGHALAVPGNHEHKLIRALGRSQVTPTHGLAETLAQLAAETPEFRQAVRDWCYSLVSHLVLDEGRLVVAHAGLKEAYHGRSSGRVRSFALYGDTTGETDEYGLPVRYPWANEYRGRAMVLYGHTPTPTLDWVNNTLCLDTGCVFGGKLSALRYPEKETVQVDAEQVWYEPIKPLIPATPARGPDDLRLDDVVGHRVIETTHQGRITVRPEQAAGALEVISRFALHPRWLRYLPPTMAPAAASARSDYLEHPDEAFADYAARGVRALICEEKHMGSRAALLLCRDAAVAAQRFGATAGETGVLYTRTGRSFFPRDLTEELLSRLRIACDRAGLWSELDTDWLLMDGELLPWSVKAEGLLKEQYASVAAAATAALSAEDAALIQALGRGLPLEVEQAAVSGRRAEAEGFRTAYRRYVWPTRGLDGVQFAPFQVLASHGHTWEERDHHWHLGLADRLAEAEPELLRVTRRLVVDPTDPDSREAAVRWWTDLTEAGGEGVVVKPLANLTKTPKGLLQPGVKVRGREYLRLIYGPEYLQPQHLERLRRRSLGLKRSLALREYALGLESLRRSVAGEPLWRVHEVVFAVLALEADPVDPRL
ncbi:MAG: polynucleotide kinase-phosphatase [Micropruina sp.]